ncbi:hypothetical protein SDJN02_16225, partial [Cucurbita argyrosperma subsp. argyrosperma]
MANAGAVVDGFGLGENVSKLFICSDEINLDEPLICTFSDHWWIAFSSDEFFHHRASQTPCVAAVEAAMYSASQENKATTFCFVDCQQIAPPERKGLRSKPVKEVVSIRIGNGSSTFVKEERGGGCASPEKKGHVSSVHWRRKKKSKKYFASGGIRWPAARYSSLRPDDPRATRPTDAVSRCHGVSVKQLEIQRALPVEPRPRPRLNRLSGAHVGKNLSARSPLPHARPYARGAPSPGAC